MSPETPSAGLKSRFPHIVSPDDSAMKDKPEHNARAVKDFVANWPEARDKWLSKLTRRQDQVPVEPGHKDLVKTSREVANEEFET
jgi:hypothetical protein